MDQQSRLLTVRMELTPINVWQVPPREILMAEMESSQALGVLTYQELQQMQEVPKGLIHVTNRDMNLNYSRITSWRTTQGTHNYSLQAGMLQLYLRVPESHLSTSCSDCKRPLGIFRIHVEWQGTFRGKPDGRLGSWCPHCWMRNEIWPKEMGDDKELMDAVWKVKSNARKGWGEKVETMKREAVERLDRAKVRSRTMSNLAWWQTQRTENTKLYQEYQELQSETSQ